MLAWASSPFFSFGLDFLSGVLPKRSGAKNLEAGGCRAGVSKAAVPFAASRDRRPFSRLLLQNIK